MNAEEDIRVEAGRTQWLGRAWILAAMVAGTSPATAENWVVLGRSGSGASAAEQAVDLDSIRREGPYVRLWVRKEFAQDQPGEDMRPYRRVVSSVAVDCDRDVMATTALFVYDQRAAVIHSVTKRQPEWEWEEYPPGSIGRAVIDFACRRDSDADNDVEGSKARLKQLASRVNALSWSSLGAFDYRGRPTDLYFAPSSVLPTDDGHLSVLSIAVPHRPEESTGVDYVLLEFFFDCRAKRFAISAVLFMKRPDVFIDGIDYPVARMRFRDVGVGGSAGSIHASICEADGTPGTGKGSTLKSDPPKHQF